MLGLSLELKPERKNDGIQVYPDENARIVEFMDCCQPKRESPSTEARSGADCCHAPGETSMPTDIWLRLGIALVVAGQTMVWGLAFNLSPPPFGSQTYLIGHGWMILSTLLVVALLGPLLIGNALRMIREKRLTVEGLFLLTALGAFVASGIATFTGEGSVYYEVVSVVLAVYVTGSYVGDRARSKTREAVQSFEEQFNEALLFTCCGSEKPVAVSTLEPGDTVIVYPGKPIPVDGEVSGGSAYLQEAALTGEPLPRAVQPGSPVRAGAWSLDGRLEVLVKARPGERELDRLIQMLQGSRELPSQLEKHADRITQYFLPLVALISAGTFFGWLPFIPWPQALFNSMAVLLVACPCALGLATPIAVWSGLWRLFQMGIISRSSTLLDGLADTRRIFFDKTGTLSNPEIRVSGFYPQPDTPWDPPTIAALVYRLEAGQNHPIAKALRQWSALEKEDPAGWRCRESRVVPGCGVMGTLENNQGETLTLRLGSQPWLGGKEESLEGKRTVALEVEGQRVGEFTFQEQLRDHLEFLFRELKERGLSCEILTGDPAPSWKTVEGIHIEANCSPEEKQKRVKTSSERGEHPLFIGDGINDTAAMQAAAASLAMGEGPELAQTLGTGVLSENALPRIPEAIDVSRALQKTLKQNLWFAAFYNGIGMALAAAGILHPVVAALLMVGSSLIVSSRAAASARKVAATRPIESPPSSSARGQNPESSGGGSSSSAAPVTASSS